jgi:competence protein ComEC
VREVPVVVLTHFHTDHVGGLGGVLRGRAVGQVLVSPLRAPPYGAGLVERLAGDTGVPVRVPAAGETLSLGPLRWQVLAPSTATSDEPNDASLVLLVEVAGVRILLSGDVEPLAQSALRRVWSVPDVDVLKVPHHGSRYQDPELLRALRPEVALVSVGDDNDYGHPDPGTLATLRSAGSTTWRTDTAGDLAVMRESSGGVTVVPRG